MKNFTSIFFIILLFLSGTAAYSVPRLNSFPSATATIYLDFDGHTVNTAFWNNGQTIICAAAPLNDAQLTEIFNRVSEDYRPFDINITTDSIKFLAAPLTQRIRVIITPSSSWRTGVGGIAYIGSFVWGDDTPAFVFSDRLGPNNAKFIAECVSHESGHTLGLAHQSSYDNNCNLTETYNTGTGSGETSWAPVMGNSYGKNMTGWNDGPTPYGCTNTQDNLSIITTGNGFGFRNDDYSETLNNSTFAPGNISFSINGIISNSTDKDAFKFEINQTSSFHFEVTPFNLGNNNSGANLDIKVLLYDGNRNHIGTYDPATTMSVTIDTTFNAGTYYFIVDGSGNLNTGNYGSLGSYSITGFRSALPIRSVTLRGRIENKVHQLDWNIVSDEAISEQTLEVSSDGRLFTDLNHLPTSSRFTNSKPADNGEKYYRLSVTAVTGQTMYSNIISLKGTGSETPSFLYNSFVTNMLKIQATSNYQYRIADMNGRVLLSGKAIAGNQQIDLSKFPSGIYLLQFFGPSFQQSERIIKQ
jgi:hypothetical protein